MNARFAMLVIGSGITVSAFAEGQTVYESLDTISVDRVFFSPDQRRQLDAARMDPQDLGVVGERSSEEPVRMRKPAGAAGFIINSTGEARSWRNGDFIEGSRRIVPEDFLFPGEVTIIRHRETSLPSGKGDVESDGKRDAESEETSNIESVGDTDNPLDRGVSSRDGKHNG